MAYRRQITAIIPDPAAAPPTLVALLAWAAQPIETDPDDFDGDDALYRRHVQWSREQWRRVRKAVAACLARGITDDDLHEAARAAYRGRLQLVRRKHGTYEVVLADGALAPTDMRMGALYVLRMALRLWRKRWDKRHGRTNR